MSTIPSSRRIARLKQVLEHRQPDLTVVMENIHDPHNVSAVFRTCDAVGVARVELLYTIEPFPRIGKKSSSSANKWLERRRHTSVRACFDTLRGEGFRIYATRIGPGTRALYDLDLTGKVALVLGNEHRGVSDEAAAAADGLVSIPMMGMIESLNVSVAAAVCLYESLRQRLAAGAYGTPSYPPEEFDALLRDWLER
jgi:tRNA (guanosine-2'-O-)-methyltransferase